MVDLNPVLTFSATGRQCRLPLGSASGAGLRQGPGIDSEVHGFQSCGGVTIGATADADLYVGMHADIGLAGPTGVGGDFGPDMPANYDPAPPAHRRRPGQGRPHRQRRHLRQELVLYPGLRHLR